MLKVQLVKNKMENKEGMNHLLINVKPLETKKGKVEKPVAFVLVLDDSGSMDGLAAHGPHQPAAVNAPLIATGAIINREPNWNLNPAERSSKLDYVKQAAERFIDMMKNDSMVGVVAFSDTATLEYPLTKLTGDEKMKAKDRVRALRTRGATNISDALELAYAQIPQDLKTTHHVKLVLLSDGEANNGIQDADGISTLASGFRKNEVSISTIGVGVTYNSHFMESIATASGGMFYHLDNMSKLNEIFTKELETLTTLTTKQAKLVVKLPSGVELKPNLNGFAEDKPGEIFLGNVFCEQDVAIEIFTEKEAEKGVKKANIRYEFTDENNAKKAYEEEIEISLVDEEEMDDVRVDKEVLAVVQKMIEANTKKQATRHYDTMDLVSVQSNFSVSNQSLMRMQNSYGVDMSKMIKKNEELETSMMNRSLDLKQSKELYTASYNSTRNRKD